MRKLASLAFCLFAFLTAQATTWTVSLETTTYPVAPSTGALEYNPDKAGNASTSGYKLGSTNNHVAWKVGQVFTHATVRYWINSNNTTYDFGVAFSTDNGATWGTTKKYSNSGIKSPNDFQIPDADIPTGANAIKFIRTCGTSSYACGFTLSDDGGGSVTPPTPTTVAVTGVVLSKTATSLTVGQTETLTATVAPTNATDQTVTWTSSNTSVATVNNGVVTAVAAGSATITVKTNDGNKTATCAVTVTAGTTPPATVAVTGVSLNKSTTSLTVGQTETLTATIAPSNATNQAVTWTSSNTNVATVNNGIVTAVAAGSATITVKTADGNKTATCAVTVTAAQNPPTPPTPSTTLTLHEPEVYEAPLKVGGYGTPLTSFENREWEVYYTVRGKVNGATVASVCTQPAVGTNSDDAPAQYMISANETSTSFGSDDGWFQGTCSSVSSQSAVSTAPFTGYSGQIKIYNNTGIEMHIKGYDQFVLLAADNNADKAKGKYIQVYVDGQLQADQISTSTSLRRYDISTGEHVIKVQGIGGSNNYLYGFALRLAYVPRLKHLAGNDSTQDVRQTDNIKPITYILRNHISDAEMAWNGATATGITLQKGTGDTLYVTGAANCPNGTYSYTLSAKDATGAVVTTIDGSFRVVSEIKALTDTIVTTFLRSSMSPVEFRYYAINDADVTLTWDNGTPVGITLSKNSTTHVATIGGTPTAVGTFPFTISVAGGNTLHGVITVESNEPTIVPGATKTMLYLYKSTKNAGLFSYLSTQYNYFARPAGAALQSAADYAAFDFIVISEDVDATNPEVLAIIKQLNKPVLNQKIFTYTPSRLGWGAPDNGSLTNTSLHVLQATHPIFAGLNSKDIQIIGEVKNNRGLMPVNISNAPGIALALAPMRGDNYDDEGDMAVLIHEVPASARGGAKYLTLPIGLESSATLTNEGKTLLRNMINYLCGSSSFNVTSDLRITAFSIDGNVGVIDENKHTITVTMPAGTNLTALIPQITLADASATITPGIGEAVDFSDQHFGVTYTVTNYVQKNVYTVTVKTPSDVEDILAEGIWMEGSILRNSHNTWLNIYTVNGTLVTTTNSDYDFDTMPRGLYLVVTESSTLKVVH